MDSEDTSRVRGAIEERDVLEASPGTYTNVCMCALTTQARAVQELAGSMGRTPLPAEVILYHR